MTLRRIGRVLLRPEVALSIAAPLIGILYAAGEYFGTWDYFSGRQEALAGLQRLEAVTGYPASWIYAEGTDQRIFASLLRRLRDFVPKDIATALKESGRKPLLITVGGEPLQLTGVPPEWEQKERAYYSTGHPILVIYGLRIEDGSRIAEGKAARACSLGELANKLEREKSNWRFYVGTLMTALLSVALIILRFAIKPQM